MESLNELFSRLGGVLNKEEKVQAVKEIVRRLVEEGVLEERALRRDVEFGEDEARAWALPAEVGRDDRGYGFAPTVMPQMQSLRRHLDYAAEITLVVEAPQTPMPEDARVDWEIRPKLERLGFQVTTWREEEGENVRECIEARYVLRRYGTAVAYLRFRDYRYP
jgi:hypothetical protein